MYRQRAMNIGEQKIFASLGEQGFAALTAAFFRRVAVDPILSTIYPRDDLAGAELRLRLFLIYRFGGPATYVEQRGHPRLRMRHAPFAIDRAAADRWVALMREAMVETKVPGAVVAILDSFFSDSATFMINRDEVPL